MTLIFQKGKRILPLPGERKAAPVKRETPPVMRQVSTVLSAIRSSAQELAQGRTPFASEEIAAERFAICSACDQFTNGRCAACNCVLQIKTRLKLALCPVGKWGPVLN